MCTARRIPFTASSSIRGIGIPTNRIALNIFASDDDWVTDYAAWLEDVFAYLT